VKTGFVAFAALGLMACSRPAGQPPRGPQPKPTPLHTLAHPREPGLLLDGSFSDGTPLNLENLRGRPWVVNLWLPG